MAFSLHHFSPLGCSFTSIVPNHRSQRALRGATTITRSMATEVISNPTVKGPRASNYQPSSWTLDFLESVGNYQAVETNKDRVKKLEEEVRFMIDYEDSEPLTLLQLIDDLQRLGLGYRLRKNITGALDKIASLEGFTNGVVNDLHATALYFRLLRQHGYQVSADVFNCFKDQNGNFKEHLCKDIKGMLSLYEASYLAFEGDKILDDAKAFTHEHLRNYVLGSHEDHSLAKQVNRALELPLHRRIPRLEAREYIEEYAGRKDANRLLLELAVLDFNLVQSTLQSDLRAMSRSDGQYTNDLFENTNGLGTCETKVISNSKSSDKVTNHTNLEDTCNRGGFEQRWWRDIGLKNKLSFARDRLMESFFWTVGMVFEPQFSSCRKGLTKTVKLITVMDDIYDEYGSLEELELFTNAVERWSIDAVEELPDYMKLCFLALYNSVNLMAYDILKDGGANPIAPLKKSWADLCKTFLKEAKWRRTQHTPTFDEYLDIGWISSSGVLLLVHAYCLMNQDITEEALDCLDKNIHLLRHPSLIFRLCNDLVSSAEFEAGETAKAIPCYMKETGASEEFARVHIRNLIDECWKKMNKGQAVSEAPFARPFVDTIINLARIAHCTYQYGDAHGAPDKKARSRVSSLLIEPVELINEKELVLS